MQHKVVEDLIIISVNMKKSEGGQRRKCQGFTMTWVLGKNQISALWSKQLEIPDAVTGNFFKLYFL